MSKNFTATRDGQLIAVTTANKTTPLTGDPNAVSAAGDALIDNRGSADCYIKFGGPDVTVSVATGVRIPAGSIAVYGKATGTHIAVIGDAATSVMVHLGEGL